jgi:DNA replication protein DnaC
MTMSMTELEQALRALRLSGMTGTLEVRAQQVAQHEMNFIEAFSWLVQDELDRRRSRLLDRRFALSGLPERKDLKDFDWSYNPKVPKRQVFELATLKFIDARENALFIGPPGVGKSHSAKAIAQLAVQRGYKVFYREAHKLIEEINEARELGEIRKYRAQMMAAELLVCDDLFLRRLPANAGDELADVLMSRYEKRSTVITSNR